MNLARRGSGTDQKPVTWHPPGESSDKLEKMFVPRLKGEPVLRKDGCLARPTSPAAACFGERRQHALAGTSGVPDRDKTIANILLSRYIAMRQITSCRSQQRLYRWTDQENRRAQMPNEELLQRGYYQDGHIRGDSYGLFEKLDLGSTSLAELAHAGLLQICPAPTYSYKQYSPPSNPGRSKPDRIYLNRTGDEISPVAIAEVKRVSKFVTADDRQAALEQAFYVGVVTGVRVAMATDETTTFYIDISQSLLSGEIVLLKESRQLTPGVLRDVLYQGTPVFDRGLDKLAEHVWQTVWHATKQDPKPCLMTFVEIFILKFLSDNLSKKYLPGNYSFYVLTSMSEQDFVKQYGRTQIEYYVHDIRPKIKAIFPEKTVISGQDLTSIFGLKTIVSPTSIINWFAFLQSSTVSLPNFNRAFMEILRDFQEFGTLSDIDPEFKLRLYETFLKKTTGKEKLGQFFTPRNVVKSMICMAQLDKLDPGSLVLDPAAGVGGFVLEPLISEVALKGNITFDNSGLPHQRVRVIGVDVDSSTHTLAKANTLIHLAELVRDPKVSIDGLNRLMSEMFILMNQDQNLGSLEFQPIDRVDVILTNPPYVTRGSRVYKDEIAYVKGLRNGQDLKEYYDRCGLGLESLFLRYIAGALKPRGRAFVIVPQGLLARTEVSTKAKILSECDLLASISLPRNTFFSTAQKTSILVLSKRALLNVGEEEKIDLSSRPSVFCAMASSIGETLNARRVPTPEDNNLSQIAQAFVDYQGTGVVPKTISDRIRVVGANEFSPSDRWDVSRFWNDEELVSLGERNEPISAMAYLDEARAQVEQTLEDISEAQADLAALSDGDTTTISLSDQSRFLVRRGIRVTRKQGLPVRGPNADIPVYSGSKEPKRALCWVSRKWAKDNSIPIESHDIVTVNANGYVGATFHRHEECIIHDDVMVIEVLSPEIDYDYLVFALRAAIAEGDFEYEAKLYSRVSNLVLQFPATTAGVPDIDRQRSIASAVGRIDALRERLSETGLWSSEARVSSLTS